MTAVGVVARFLFQKGHYSSQKGIVKPGAFLPKNGQTSVFEVSGLEEEDVRLMGDAAGRTRGRSPRGRGELETSDVTAAGLRFERDDVPPRHGNLVGWPSHGKEVKARCKAVAVELAVRAVLVLHTP